MDSIPAMEMGIHNIQGHLQQQLAMAALTVIFVTSTVVIIITIIIIDLHHLKPAGSMESMIRSSLVLLPIRIKLKQTLQLRMPIP
jgi:hypothetical protein